MSARTRAKESVRVMLFRNRKPERWPVIQIEVTSRCLLRCGFCPNKTVGGHWIHGDLPWETYRDHVGPHLSRFDLVYLQGWGEPMLHPHLCDMIGLAKTAGCRVGFTTCGGLLTAERTEHLLELGLDILSVSFAGASRERHEGLRHGSGFDQLAENVGRVAAARARGLGAQLRLELHLLMMRDNICDLPAFVRLAASLGADEVVATNLTYAANPDIAAWQVFGPEPEPAHLQAVEDARLEARRLKIGFRPYPLSPEPHVLECDARPTETVYVTHRGQVAPCVYLGMPVQDWGPRIYEGEPCPVQPLVFGTVQDGLIEVIQGPARARFCAPFRARKQAAFAALALLSSGGQDMELPAAPAACRGCYKMMGV